jgi:hypothetical protein
MAYYCVHSQQQQHSVIMALGAILGLRLCRVSRHNREIEQCGIAREILSAAVCKEIKRQLQSFQNQPSYNARERQLVT